MQWPWINPVCATLICLLSGRQIHHPWRPLLEDLFLRFSMVTGDMFIQAEWNLIYWALQCHNTHSSSFLSLHLSFLAIHIFLSFCTIHHFILLFIFFVQTLFLSFPSLSPTSCLLAHVLLILAPYLLLFYFHLFLPSFHFCSPTLFVLLFSPWGFNLSSFLCFYPSLSLSTPATPPQQIFLSLFL